VQNSYYERVSETQAVSVDLVEMEPTVLWVARVFCPVAARRQGHATRLMQRVLREADREGFTIRLVANPYEGSNFSESDLTDWYVSLGFRPEETEPKLLVRRPQPPDATLSERPSLAAG